MTHEQFLLLKIMEEAAEVQQIASKAMQFGLHEKLDDAGPSNAERLTAEFRDLLAHAEMLEDFYIPDLFGTEEERVQHTDRKYTKTRHFHGYSNSLGQVEQWPDG